MPPPLALKPTFVIQSHPGMQYGWIWHVGDPIHEGDGQLTDCMPDTEAARDFIKTIDAWRDGMEDQNNYVEDSWFEPHRPTPPPFDWTKWELVGVALAVRLSALVGPSWIIKYDRAFYGPYPHVCLWSSE